MNTPEVLHLLTTRARLAVVTAATPHLRRVFDHLTGEVTAWAVAHDDERAARLDRDLQLAREHAIHGRAIDALQARLDGRREQMALGALLAMPWVRRGLGETRWAYFAGEYGGGVDCGLAEDEVAA